ncbi:MAG: glycerol-3-phosphate 1-O-acyltransferase PlsY [Planctomycetaceae bacterium]|nr:glycerol-3-phosphate 1-O-acyltransferase PlsY [Planctomycetaceae bacterium]MBT6484681.1 glycerol-3-phosphate 1-O-acyltransferase PlsY [Planctomycetaceae bacterium]MBT6497923.1 glycerol-3-phosphate 1-O-acyltransferase PlsY [Planctomycetaceae bacterium]
MNASIVGFIVIFLAYVIGSLPFGYLTARFAAGIDIRQHGSKNIGATNVARVLGKKLGLLVLLLDCLKGLLPAWLLAELFRSLTGDSADALHIRVACGVATVVGHMFPCWLKFRGGKGVATALGVAGILSWQATLAAMAIFFVTFSVSRIVSLSSMLAASGYAAAHLLLTKAPFSTAEWSLTAFSLTVPALIVIRHRTNIVRLWRGEEPRFGATKTNDVDAVNHQTSE